MKIRKLRKNKNLSLKNNGTLSIFWIGVGSAFSKRHFQTNCLIIKGDDHLMVDCGTKTPQALYELGLGVTDIHNFLITHSHADHIGGLEEVMLVNRYVARSKPSIIINKTYQNLLWDMSLRGGSAFNEEQEGSVLGFGNLWKIQRPVWLEGYPRETLEADAGSINLKLFRTKHIPDSPNTWQNSFWSCGLIIDDRIMFTSDTRYDPELIEQYTQRFDFEMIFHDCQFFTGGVHAGIEEIKAFPPEVKKKMVLTHYGDNWEDFTGKVKEYGFHSLAKQWHFYEFPST
jgi:ribonuclease BN (tRNA processing enzyme)